MNYLKQIWYEFKERPLVTWVTIGGTALSLFLIMSVYMVNQATMADVAPQSNRSRTLKGMFIHVKTPNGEMSSSMSAQMARRLYEDLEGVEMVSYNNSWNDNVSISYSDSEAQTVRMMRTDDKFWKIFDYSFISGSPFTAAEVAADAKEVILAESVAREIGGGRDLTGKEVIINYIPYHVKGVVKDVNPLLQDAWAQVWGISKDTPVENKWTPEEGQILAYLKLADGTDPGKIKKEVERRYEVYNSQIKKEGKELFYHGSPFTAEEAIMDFGSNTTPDVEHSHRMRWLLYTILLILPAINLSGMTRSRLRRRVSEIGVRRAFGATRGRIVLELLTENFILTVIGGLIGLLCCVLFVMCFSHLFVNYVNMWNTTSIQAVANPDFGMLFTWPMFLTAFGLCFLLNILSTGIPAWKATSENPAEAITGSAIR